MRRLWLVAPLALALSCELLFDPGRLGPRPTFDTDAGVAQCRKGSCVLVAGHASDLLYLIDVSDRQPRLFLTVGGVSKPVRLTQAADRVLIANSDINTVSDFDLASFSDPTELGSFSNSPTDVALSPQGETAYVAFSQAAPVAIHFDGTRTTATGSGFAGRVVMPAGGKEVWANWRRGTPDGSSQEYVGRFVPTTFTSDAAIGPLPCPVLKNVDFDPAGNAWLFSASCVQKLEADAAIECAQAPSPPTLNMGAISSDGQWVYLATSADAGGGLLRARTSSFCSSSNLDGGGFTPIFSAREVSSVAPLPDGRVGMTLPEGAQLGVFDPQTSDLRVVVLRELDGGLSTNPLQATLYQ